MSTGGPQSLDARLLRLRAGSGSESATDLAADLLAASRAAEALEVTTAGLAQRPDDADLLVLDGRARLAESDLLGAQAALLEAAKVAPQRKDPFRWMGEVLLERGDPLRAAKVLQRAATLDPHDPAVAELRARADRLSRLAEGEAPPPGPARAAAPPPPEPPPPIEEPEERTVVRADLTEPLPALVPEEARARQAGEPALTPSPPAGATADSFGDETTNSQRPVDPADDFDEGPTRVRPLPVPPLPVPPPGTTPAVAPKPPVARTLTFGSDAASPPATPEAPSVGGTLPAATAADPFAALGPLAAPFSPDPPASTAPDRLGTPLPPTPVSGDPFADDEPAGPNAAVAPASEPLAPEPLAPEPLAPEALAPEPLAPGPFAAAPTEAEPVVALGGDAEEDVGHVVEMPESHDRLERPEPVAEPTAWAGRAEVRASQTSGARVGLRVGIVSGLAAVLMVGGYFGWNAWMEHRRGQAAQRVEEAMEAAYRGDHRDLVDAERILREARDLDGRDANGPTLLLFVHAQRALEGGAFQADFLRPALQGGEAVGANVAYLDMARAVLAAAENRADEAGQQLDAALEARPRDPAILYLAGRLGQRLGREASLAQLEAAIEADPQLVAPRIALAEARHDEGRAEDALALLAQVLERDAEHLRARLWQAYLTSEREEPAAALAGLDAMETTVEDHGAPTDRVLLELARSRSLRRQGTLESAGQAVDRALAAGGSEPRLLALVATEGRRASRLPRAEQAARTALSGAPHNAAFRKLLAGIELDRRNGRGALSTLATLDAADPDVVRMRAQAALLVGTADALQAAAEALDAHVAGDAEAAIDVRALRVRVHVRIGDVADLIAQARALAQQAPGDPTVTLALGEAALHAQDGATAAEALAQAALSAPDDAEVHYLLGRARRMTGDAEGAEQSLRRAVELSAELVEARLALGGLLLDTGRYADADELYAELPRSARSANGQEVTVAGRLGRVEALLGLGRLDDAQVQLEALAPEVRQAPTAQVLAARLALARGRPGEALGPLRALATAEETSALVVALYADALLAAGQIEPAVESYARALTLDGGLPEARIGQADMAVRSERGDDALLLLEQVERGLERRIHPPALRARLLYLRGRAQLLQRRGGEATARESLRAAVATEGAPPEAHFYLGEALAGDNSPESRAAYERYLELAPQGSLAARARRAVGRR